MVIAALAGVAALAAAAWVYLKTERLGRRGIVPAALRGLSVGALILLVANPRFVTHPSPTGRTVLLDASLSMDAAGARWREAVDRARQLAGDGAIYRFGTTLAPFDTAAPDAGASRLAPALAVARAWGRPVTVVTDGEISDVTLVPPAVRADVRFVVLARRATSGVAIQAVGAPQSAVATDPLTLELEVRTWGEIVADSALVVVTTGRRRLASRRFSLPPPPGTGVRRLVLPAGTLLPGNHVLEVTISATGDPERRDDRRYVPLSITDRPTIVLLSDAPDWETRFLFRTLAEVSGVRVEGYVSVMPGAWRNVATVAAVSAERVRRRAGAARLVVLQGTPALSASALPEQSRWRWRGAASDSSATEGEWYASPLNTASPLEAALTGVVWDSLPPLNAVTVADTGRGEWRAIGARRQGRGVPRPIFVGRVEHGARTIETLGSGLWRWAFRGGVAGDAFRVTVAAALDWLLPVRGTERGNLVASRVVERGLPIEFRWRAGAPPDSLVVTFEGAASRADTIRFAPDGTALVALPPGIYRWRAAGSEGLVAVESFSREYLPQPVAALAGAEAGDGRSVARTLRAAWWPFALALAALFAEWAWRQWQGLP